MPALISAGRTFPAARMDSLPPPDTWHRHTARCIARWGRCGAVISVHGELDASNAGQLADYVQRCAQCCEWLVLDLYALDFLGTTGFSALQSIIGYCAETDVHCTVVPGDAVARLLRICDPACVLPMTTSVAEALVGVPRLRPVI